MSTYGNELEHEIHMYERALPEEFKERVNPRNATLDKETARSTYLFGILENSITLLDGTADKRTKGVLAANMEGALKHFAEGGGAGAETFTRLMALGIIDEIPHIHVSYSTEWVPPDKSLVEVDRENGVIDLLVRFNAHVPDEHGQETWKDNDRMGNVCTSRITLNLSDRENITSFIKELHEDYEQLMKIKHPPRKN